MRNRLSILQWLIVLMIPAQVLLGLGFMALVCWAIWRLTIHLTGGQ